MSNNTRTGTALLMGAVASLALIGIPLAVNASRSHDEGQRKEQVKSAIFYDVNKDGLDDLVCTTKDDEKRVLFGYRHEPNGKVVYYSQEKITEIEQKKARDRVNQYSEGEGR